MFWSYVVECLHETLSCATLKFRQSLAEVSYQYFVGVPSTNFCWHDFRSPARVSLNINALHCRGQTSKSCFGLSRVTLVNSWKCESGNAHGRVRACVVLRSLCLNCFFLSTCRGLVQFLNLFPSTLQVAPLFRQLFGESAFSASRQHEQFLFTANSRSLCSWRRQNRFGVDGCSQIPATCDFELRILDVK